MISGLTDALLLLALLERDDGLCMLCCTDFLSFFGSYNALSSFLIQFMYRSQFLSPEGGGRAELSL